MAHPSPATLSLGLRCYRHRMRFAVRTYGNPAPSIQFSALSGTTVTGEVRVSAGGSVFRFKSFDLYSSTTVIPYTFKGFRNSSTVFTFADTLPQTFGNFRTVANPNAS